MRVVVRCGGGGAGAEEELRSLYAWLLAEPAARRHGRPELGASRQQPAGHQGEIVDILSLVLSSGFSAASLAVAVAAWRDTRPRRPVVTVQRPDGVEVTIANASTEEAERLIRRLFDEPGERRDGGRT